MKSLKNVLEARGWDIIDNNRDADFIIIDTESYTIDFATLKEVQNDEWTFGEATKDVLNLKPLESLEDSICIYIRIK